MANEFPKRPVSFSLLIVLLLFQGLSGIAGGIFLIIDPSGETINIPLQWLEGSPFSNYLIPGIILFSLLGIVPMMVVFMLRKKMPGSRHYALLVGVALVIWILVEILIIGYQASPPLQAIYGPVGLIIGILALMPSVKAYCD
jgi:multidrug transporter EmrE-like cation transporter